MRTVDPWTAAAQATGAALACVALEGSYYTGTVVTFADSFSWTAIVGGFLLLSAQMLALQLVCMAPAFVLARWRSDLASRLLPVVPALVVGMAALSLGQRILTPVGNPTLMWAWRLVPLLAGAATYSSLSRTIGDKAGRWTRAAAPSVLAVAILWVFVRTLSSAPASSLVGDPLENRPHIIFLAGDGIEARSLTPYGSVLDTSPYLAALAQESVLYENAFANSGKTTGSTTSMLSGLHPLEMKVMFPPQISSGSGSYRSLPRMLTEWGYRGIQHSIRFYADAEDLNLVGGFEKSNGRLLAQLPALPVLRVAALAVNDELYLGRRLWGGLVERLYTLVTGEVRVDAFRDVGGESELDARTDRAALEDALEFLDQSDGPVLMHLHLLGPHCCDFNNVETHFTEADAARVAGPVDSLRRRAKYLSTVREFDDNVAFFVEALRERDALEETILVISSDHSTGWRAVERMPLMVRFPGAAITGSVRDNVELQSVPATVLHALGEPAPPWMAPRLPLPGESKGSGGRIVGVDHVALVEHATQKFQLKDKLGFRQIGNPGPPEFGIGVLSVVECNHWARWGVEDQAWSRGEVSGHTAPCELALTPQALDQVLEGVEVQFGVDLRR